MREQRGLLAVLALALLFGAAGAPAQPLVASGPLGPTEQAARGATTADALASPLWEQALASPRGGASRPTEERTGGADGDTDRHPPTRAIDRASTPGHCAHAPPAASRATSGVGARLLGLPHAPANAPPVS